jgi:hypothetical protein
MFCSANLKEEKSDGQKRVSGGFFAGKLFFNYLRKTFFAWSRTVLVGKFCARIFVLLFVPKMRKILHPESFPPGKFFAQSSLKNSSCQDFFGKKLSVRRTNNIFFKELSGEELST